MATAKCIFSRRALQCAYTPSIAHIAARPRAYSAVAAAEETNDSAGPSTNSGVKSPSIPIGLDAPVPSPVRAPKAPRPISNRRRAAFERAKQNAEALRRSISDGDPTNVSLVDTEPVASSSTTRADGKQKIEAAPTLETLESYRPEREPQPHNKNYKARYDRVWWALANAFLRKQLLKLAREMGFRGPNQGTTKDDLIEWILRSWGWRPVKEIAAELEAKAEAMRVVERVIPLSHMEMFVLLRKSPRVLTDIAERQHMSITLSQAPELGLKARGMAVHLGHLETVLNDMKKTIVHEYFSAEDVGGVLPHWLPAVAEMTGAFIEALPAGMYKVSSTSSRQATAAKQLLRVAWVKNVYLPKHRPLLSLVPDSTPKPLAMYPFLPAPAAALDWDASGRPLFRVRTVGSWFAVPKAVAAKLNDVQKVRGEGEATKLADWLQGSKGPDGSSERLIARFGHVLHATPDDAKVSSSLTPPLHGQWRIEALQQWAKDGASVFTPGLPPAYAQTAPPASTPTLSRKLLYREIGSDKFFALECTYPKPAQAAPAEPKADWAAELDLLLEGLEEPVETEPKPLQVTELDIISRFGAIQEVDVMMPDRAIDARITVENSLELERNVPPPQFGAFLEELAAQHGSDRQAQPPRSVNLQVDGKVLYELVEDFEIERVSEGPEISRVTRKDVLAGGRSVAPELVIEQSSADVAALISAISEATKLPYSSPAATTWTMPIESL